MSGSNFPAEPFAEFIDDYFMECDDHLAVARRSLLALEPGLAGANLDLSLLDDLFRSFHSIKGLSAMVGVREAELLAHQMESYLSALRKGTLRLNPEGLEALIAGVKLLDVVVAARRTHAEMPDVRDLVARFAALVSRESAAPGLIARARPDRHESSPELSPEKQQAVETAIARGERVWRLTFTPSPELAARGINVTVMRERLESRGKVIDAAPVTVRKDQIAFVFLLASAAGAGDFAAWAADGLTCEPFESAAPVELPVQEETVLPAADAVDNSPSTITNVVRVDLARLDALMRMVGELVISRARLDSHLKRTEASLAAAEWRPLNETNLALERQLRDLREGIMRVRMVPVREVFSRMQFVVRDLTHEHNKSVRLALVGQETEIDKYIVERILDPLLHLVRNAVSHGLETATERIAAGKPAEGRLELAARTTGDSIEIEVADDGRGIDVAQVLTRGRAAGLATANAIDDAAAVLDVICAPGFSTRDAADLASGRGMGMSAVRETVEQMGGTLSLQTTLGSGTRFAMELPLTLSIADALIVSAQGQTFAVPQASVHEIIEVDAALVQAFENNEVVVYRERALPLVRLATFFGLGNNDSQKLSILVVGEGRSAFGIGVDRVAGLQEIVVRPLTDPLVQVRGVGGATELGDGRVVLILDTLHFTRATRATRAARTRAPAPLTRTGARP